MDLELKGRTALVAGGSRGIGLAIARRLAAEGCNVALIARDAAGLTAAATALPGASTHAADLTDGAATEAAVAEAAARWGGLDIVICNAGSGRSVPPGEETEAEWRRVLDINLFTATNTIAAARPVLAKRTGDRAIVCISSITGLAALGAPVAYSAAKAALNATVRGLARPLAGAGIRINAVAPGNILFEGGTWARKLGEDRAGVEAMLQREVALKRLGTPEEIADVVTFLASPRAAFVTGTVLVADGGQLRS